MPDDGGLVLTREIADRAAGVLVVSACGDA